MKPKNVIPNHQLQSYRIQTKTLEIRKMCPKYDLIYCAAFNKP